MLHTLELVALICACATAYYYVDYLEYRMKKRNREHDDRNGNNQ